MKYILKISCILLSNIYLLGFGQTIEPGITYRVDTNKSEIKNIYLLMANYLNSMPDSSYYNQYWNTNELKSYELMPYPDEANWFMFKKDSKGFLNDFKPVILSIEKIEDYFTIQTLFVSFHPNDDIIRYNWNPPYITKYIAIQENNEWKLANNITYEIKNWNNINTKYINFHFPCNVEIDSLDLLKSNSFCDSIYSLFELQWNNEPFDYYITNSVYDLNILFNFEYTISPITGITNKPLNRIFSSRGNGYHPHEFVHIILPPINNSFLSEGIATWIGGTGNTNESFLEQIDEFCNQISIYPEYSIELIYTNKIKNPLDNNLKYLSSALICLYIYENFGINGIQKLMCFDKTSYEDLVNFMNKNFNLNEDKLNEIVFNWKCIDNNRN